MERNSNKIIVCLFCGVFVITLIMLIGYLCYSSKTLKDSQVKIVNERIKHIAKIDSIFYDMKTVVLSNDSGTIVNAPALLSQLQNDSALFRREISLSQEEVNNLVALHINKIDNDYSQIGIWGGLLSIIFLIFGFFAIFKIEETKTEEKKKTEVTKYVSAETLNMRETANNNAKLINQLKVNTKVTVLETEGTWSKIKVNGKTGYVASKYLSDKKVDVTSRSEEISRGKENTQTENTSSKNESSTQGTSSSASGNNIVAYAKKYMGYKYVSGGSSPSTGFDCSGFTSYVYKQCGISISRSSSAQASNGTAVSKSNLQPGDLVIFNNRANTSIGHVGIYIGGNTFIHAGNSGTGVITTSLSDSYYQARYVTGRRIIN